MGDNLVVTFLGWEGVGACSYFLIGFWFTDMLKAKAAQKAFIANRIGDFAFLVAMFLIYTKLGTLRYVEIQEKGLPHDIAFWATLLLFIASTGKSAQIPLYVWLPDAMAGPTPVSALIHAATMVTSGIYLIARMSWIYATVPEVLLIICGVAALTAILAASIAIAQNDIKKVLAYSTVSQLGYMFMALGAGAYATAIFHVFTHAFFKACLFLGSGSVIHGMEHTHAVKDPQDIRTMGGLRKYMPSTAITFWIATFAIAGIPPLAGFFSKDEILAKTFAMGHEHGLYFAFWFVGVMTAFLTAFYMTRLAYLTFEGTPRFPAQEHPPHESPAIMTIPLWILAFFSVIAGVFGLPEWIAHGEYHWIGHQWLAPPKQGAVVPSDSHLSLETELVLMGLSIGIAVLGVLTAWRLYNKKGLEGDKEIREKLGALYGLLENKYYVDEIYQKWIIDLFVWVADKIVVWFDETIVDGIVDGIGSLTLFIGNGLKYLQTGVIRHYALLMWIGVLLLVLYVLLGMG
jgi:NADH-quinone oxidoreductase subunit L